jgi:hypothetical protein
VAVNIRSHGFRSDLGNGYTYLFPITANLAVFPLGTTKLLQVLCEVSVRSGSETVVETWQLFAKETLLSTVTSDGAATSFVLWGKWFSVDDTG